MFRHVYYSFFLLNRLLCPLASLGANPAPTCAESLSTRLASVASTVLPWESDTLGHQWSGRQKYFLIVGVTKLGFASGNNDDFATVDTAQVAEVLCNAGYQPIPS